MRLDHRSGEGPGRDARGGARLDQAGIEVGELALRRSSLDEVFLALTGHRAEPESDGEGPGAADGAAAAVAGRGRRPR